MDNKLFLFSILFFAFNVETACAQNSLRIALESNCADTSSLQLSVTNESSKSIKFEESLLPWNDGSKSVQFNAYEILDGKTRKISGQSAVGDYLRIVLIKPKQKLRNKIIFKRRFVDFESIHRSSDIVIFYNVNGNAPKDRTGVYGNSGIIFIPKDKWFSKSCPVVISR